MGKNNWVVGLDIGTTKVCAIVGEPTEHGLDIVGIGTHPSRGLRKGVVVNIEATVNSIRRAVEEAELMSGGEITQAYTGIAGAHIKGVNSHGIVAIKDKEVKPSDVDRVIDAAQAIAIPLDRELIHVVPQEFVVDDQDGVKDPVGMSGVRLEAKVHIVTGAVTSAQNIIKCCNRTGLNVADIALEQLASAEAVLSIGGNHLTSDIAAGLRTPIGEAERIKQRYGYARTSMVTKDETVEVPSVGGRNSRAISRQILCEIIEPRLEEIFQLVRREITRSGYEGSLASGMVMTGGSTLLPGMIEMAEQIFSIPVRLGVPTHVGGLIDVVSSPIYSTGVGLVLYGIKRQDKNFFRIRDNNLFGKVRNRMVDWFSEFF